MNAGQVEQQFIRWVMKDKTQYQCLYANSSSGCNFCHLEYSSYWEGVHLFKSIASVVWKSAVTQKDKNRCLQLPDASKWGIFSELESEMACVSLKVIWLFFNLVELVWCMQWSCCIKCNSA